MSLTKIFAERDVNTIKETILIVACNLCVNSSSSWFPKNPLQCSGLGSNVSRRGLYAGVLSCASQKFEQNACAKLSQQPCTVAQSALSLTWHSCLELQCYERQQGERFCLWVEIASLLPFPSAGGFPPKVGTLTQTHEVPDP